MAQVEPQRRNFDFAFRTLRHRNYRLFFAGQAISLIGTWITRIAMSWPVDRLTGSAFTLSPVSFVGPVPTFLPTPPGGLVPDRRSCRRFDRDRGPVSAVGSSPSRPFTRHNVANLNMQALIF
jgi:hypothetical protein